MTNLEGVCQPCWVWTFCHHPSIRQRVFVIMWVTILSRNVLLSFVSRGVTTTYTKVLNKWLNPWPLFPRQSVLDLLCWLSHVDAWRGSVWPLCDGIVDSDFPTVDFCVTHGVLGRLGVFQGLEVDEGEPPGATGLSVKHHLKFLEGTELRKLLLQLTLSCVKAQTEHSKTGTCLWRVPAKTSHGKI